MSAVIDANTVGRARAPEFPLFNSAPVMIAVALIMVVGAGMTLAGQVWRDNIFLDTDDAMRMVEVRDFLHGQGWFDLSARRLDPPDGVVMHWSRFIDAPLALLVHAFAPLAGEDTAERITRLIWPWLLHLALLASIVCLARRLIGTAAIAPAAFLAALTLVTSTQFIPGRIDHHSVEILLMVLMLRMSVEALDPDRPSWRAACGAAALAILALAISLEDLPFVGAMTAAFGLAWIVSGAALRLVVLAFGASFALAGLAGFVLTVPASQYGAVFCDNYTLPHGMAAVLGGLGLAALGAATPRLPGLRSRAVAAASVGGIVVAALALAFPACIGDPLRAVDPVVRDFWLDHVNEARSLPRFFRDTPMLALTEVGPILVGLGAIIAAFLTTAPGRRAPWLCVLLFSAAGLACAVWQIRVLPPAAALAVLGGAWAVVRMARRRHGTLALRYGLVGLAFVLVCPAAWSLALGLAAPPEAARTDQVKICLDPHGFEPLSRLEPGLVLAPIDLGAHLLAFTPMDVMAAPYHRNNDGNRAVIEAMSAAPVRAREIAKDRGVAYVVTCDALNEVKQYEHRAPRGFAAGLRSDAAPSWLEALALDGTSLRVFRVRP